jgi:hypothetical protein
MADFRPFLEAADLFSRRGGIVMDGNGKTAVGSRTALGSGSSIESVRHMTETRWIQHNGPS